MDELQKLNGELDIAQTARTEFDLALNFIGRNVLGDAFAHPSGALDKVLAAGR